MDSALALFLTNAASRASEPACAARPRGWSRKTATCPFARPLRLAHRPAESPKGVVDCDIAIGRQNETSLGRGTMRQPSCIGEHGFRQRPRQRTRLPGPALVPDRLRPASAAGRIELCAQARPNVAPHDAVSAASRAEPTPLSTACTQRHALRPGLSVYQSIR